MTRNRWLVVVGAIVAAVVIVFLLVGSGGSGSATTTTTATATATAAATATKGDVRKDPREGASGSIAGTISDEKGSPIGGAWVCLLIAWDDEDTAADLRREPRCTESGADGRWKAEGLWAAKWTVTAGAEGRIPAAWQDPERRGRGWVRLGQGEAKDGIDLRLDGGAVKATGVVYDITGGPVAGAFVHLSPNRWNTDRGACFTRSGDDGTFSCWIEPGDASGSAQAEGYGSGWGQAIVPGESFEIYLTPEATIGGVVVEAGSGAPVAGARVQLAQEWGPGESVFSDGQGRFRFTRIWPGRYKAVASTEGGYGESAESVQVGIAQTRDDLVVELHPATVVAGTVMIDGAEPKPAEDCSVSLARRDGRRYDEQSDGDGEVHFDAVQPGTYEVSLWCQGLVPRAKYDDVEVAAEKVEQVWLVDEGVVLRGLVVDDRGEPIARAGVSARNVGGDPRAARGAGWETADRDGRFEIRGLKPGSVEVSANSDDHVEETEPTRLDITGDAEVTLKLSAGGMIEGRVVDEQGAPVDDAQVYARGERWGGWARNRDDGTFTMKALAPGAYRITASRGWGESMRRPGSSDDDLQGERVTVAAGETTRVTLVVEGASGTITGRVVDAVGRPVTDAFIKAERESEAAGRQRGGGLRDARWGWDEKPAVTDLDGRFTVERLAPGKYTVLAYRRGGSDAYAEGVAVGSDVTLTIEPTASLAGTVETGGGAPREIRISIADSDTGVERTEQFFMQGGAWVIRDLPAGKYDVSATAAEGSAVLEDVALAEGEHRTGIALTLRKMITITGRIVDADTREPVAGMMVSATPVEGASAGGYVFYFNSGGDKDNVSDAGGKFTLDDVPQGKVRVNARPRDWGASPYARGAKLVELGDGDPIDVGDVPVLERRTPRGKRGGDFGFTLHEQPPDTDPAAVVMKVASVRAGGPAAAAGLAVDDVIVAVDGRDVRGEASWQYGPTVNVPEGTAVTFGLERGVTLKIRAGRPE